MSLWRFGSHQCGAYSGPTAMTSSIATKGSTLTSGGGLRMSTGGAGRSPRGEAHARLRAASMAPSSQMLCLRVSGITKTAIRNMTAGTMIG